MRRRSPPPEIGSPPPRRARSAPNPQREASGGGDHRRVARRARRKCAVRPICFAVSKGANEKAMFFDPTYFLFLLPALALSLWASWRTKAAFKICSKVRTARGLAGAWAGTVMLRGAGVWVGRVVVTVG